MVELLSRQSYFLVCAVAFSLTASLSAHADDMCNEILPYLRLKDERGVMTRVSRNQIMKTLFKSINTLAEARSRGAILGINVVEVFGLDVSADDDQWRSRRDEVLERTETEISEDSVYSSHSSTVSQRIIGGWNECLVARDDRPWMYAVPSGGGGIAIQIIYPTAVQLKGELKLQSPETKLSCGEEDTNSSGSLTVDVDIPADRSSKTIHCTRDDPTKDVVFSFNSPLPQDDLQQLLPIPGIIPDPTAPEKSCKLSNVRRSSASCVQVGQGVMATVSITAGNVGFVCTNCCPDGPCKYRSTGLQAYGAPPNSFQVNGFPVVSDLAGRRQGTVSAVGDGEICFGSATNYYVGTQSRPFGVNLPEKLGNAKGASFGVDLAAPRDPLPGGHGAKYRATFSCMSADQFTRAENYAGGTIP